jgi:hypothetical protein
MRGYILCQIKRAKFPYYIESISTNIYSIEELCFYLYHNVYLIDDTIINERLCDWLKEELGLTKLYTRLYEHLEQGDGMGNFILPIFKEINYLSYDSFQKMQGVITQIEALPLASRLKLKADYLINNAMYTNAIQSYHSILKEGKNSALPNHFYASVWSNLGCGYAKLYLFKEAAACFYEAFQIERVMNIYEKYLCAIRMTMSAREFEEEVKAGTIDIKTVNGLENKMEAFRENVEEYDVYQRFLSAEDKEVQKSLLKQLTKKYHKGTCS